MDLEQFMIRHAAPKKSVPPEKPEAEGKALVSDAIAKKRKYEKATAEALDMGFYFSVVFSTRKERDAWLQKHGICLRDDDHVRPEDLWPDFKKGGVA